MANRTGRAIVTVQPTISLVYGRAGSPVSIPHENKKAIYGRTVSKILRAG